MRNCSTCGAKKLVTEFRPPPHQTQCKACYNEYMRVWRTARTGSDDAPRCSVSGCSRVATSQSLCRMHYNRFKRYGYVGDADPWIGSGDDVRYQAVHRRLMKERGRASDHTCACGDQAAHWAFVERTSDPCLKIDDGLRYSTDLSTYEPMCSACHRRHDGASYQGSRNGAAVLSEEQVLAIRAEHAKTGIAYGRLGDKYGVSATTIGMIVRRENWNHI